jgi:hypothetical protein
VKILLVKLLMEEFVEVELEETREVRVALPALISPV